MLLGFVAYTRRSGWGCGDVHSVDLWLALLWVGGFGLQVVCLIFRVFWVPKLWMGEFFVI